MPLYPQPCTHTYTHTQSLRKALYKAKDEFADYKKVTALQLCCIISCYLRPMKGSTQAM